MLTDEHCNDCIAYKFICVTKEWIVNVNDECLVFIYILAAKYDGKYLENSKIGLENSWILFLTKECEPCVKSQV